MLSHACLMVGSLCQKASDFCAGCISGTVCSAAALTVVLMSEYSASRWSPSAPTKGAHEFDDSRGCPTERDSSAVAAALESWSWSRKSQSRSLWSDRRASGAMVSQLVTRRRSRVRTSAWSSCASLLVAFCPRAFRRLLLQPAKVTRRQGAWVFADTRSSRSSRSSSASVLAFSRPATKGERSDLRGTAFRSPSTASVSRFCTSSSCLARKSKKERASSGGLQSSAVNRAANWYSWGQIEIGLVVPGATRWIHSWNSRDGGQQAPGRATESPSPVALTSPLSATLRAGPTSECPWCAELCYRSRGAAVRANRGHARSVDLAAMPGGGSTICTGVCKYNGSANIMALQI
uniref:Secreted protein n=1 Tax=Macrostomum lignano TaxID=282301 RepID=A0A1I8HFN0_9PLAT